MHPEPWISAFPARTAVLSGALRAATTGHSGSGRPHRAAPTMWDMPTRRFRARLNLGLLVCSCSGAALSVASATLAVGQTAQELRPPVFGEKVEVVSVDALVLDGRGNPARGLTQRDFTVKEDGVVQSVVSFEAISFEESEPSEAERDR